MKERLIERKYLTNAKKQCIICKVFRFTGEKMSKDLKFCMLLDFYGSLLSERQQQVMELYYNQDLSLAEISEQASITRQGVRDAVKKAEQILEETERKLSLVERFQTVSRRVLQIKERLLELRGRVDEAGQKEVDWMAEELEKVRE